MKHPVFAVGTLVLGLTAAVLARTGQPQATQAPPREQPGVTFKVEINYVEVDAIVTDARGRLVHTLTKHDFEVLEDGRPQTVSSFALVDIPVERVPRPLYQPTAIEPDVRTNAGGVDCRIFVIVLDDLKGSTLPQARDEIRELCRVSGIPLCQLSSRFEGAAPGLRLQDTHLSRAGHAAAAEELFLCLRQLGLAGIR